MEDSLRETFRTTIQVASELRVDGIEGIAADLGKSANYLYRAANMNGNEGPFDLFQLPRLIEVTNNENILHVLGFQRNKVMIALPQSSKPTKVALDRYVNNLQRDFARFLNGLIDLRDFNDDARAKTVFSRLRTLLRELVDVQQHLRATNQMSLL